MRTGGDGALGFGIGFRPKHAQALLAENGPARRVDWLEAVTENFIRVGGRPMAILMAVREKFPLALHGVGLSIAGAGSLDARYLDGLNELIERTEPRLVSDHLCWTSHRGANSHDLLPVAYTEDALAHVARRVDQVQQKIGRRLYLENPTAYVAFAASEMGEAEFLAELCRRSGCGLLLDLNNVFVNSMNLGIDAARYLATLDPETIAYFHLAGHTVTPKVRIDTHDARVPDEVWELYRAAVSLFPKAATLVEWDSNIPELETAWELAADRGRQPRSATGDRDRRPAPAAKAGDQSRLPWREIQDDFFAMTITGKSVADSDPRLAILDPAVMAAPIVGINVYADGFHLRISDVAREVFPGVLNVLGDTAFRRLMSEYLTVHPPSEVSIKYAMRDLPRFLRTWTTPSGFAGSSRILSDMAKIEWATEDLFDAPDGPEPLKVGILEEILPEDWERVGFDFIAAMRLVRAESDVGAVLDAVADGLVPEPPEEGRRDYIVFRAGNDVERRPLPVEDAELIHALAAGRTFRQACGDLAVSQGLGDDPELVERAAGVLVRCLSLGLVHGVRLDT